MECRLVSKEEFEAHIDTFSTLYQMCFHQGLSPEEIRWRYFDNPKKDLLAAFALDNDRLVANYSVSPTELVHSGEIIPAVLSLNTMTHPDYCGKDLFVKLAEMVYTEAARRGYQLVFGFPNYISHRTFTSKLNWEDICEIPMLELNLAQCRAKSVVCGRVARDDRFDLNYAACTPAENTIAVRKTPAYLKWKFTCHPTTHYENHVIADESGTVNARIVCKEYQDRLNIVDYYYQDLQQFDCLLSHIIAYAKSLNKRLVTLWAVLGTKEHILLEKYGFRNNYPVTYFGTGIFSGEKDTDYCRYSNWRVHLSDDNVY